MRAAAGRTRATRTRYCSGPPLAAKEPTITRVAVFDPFSGASGDMMLGALVDAGLPLSALRDGLQALDLTGYQLENEPVAQHSITGTRVTVRLNDASEQPARSWADIRTLIESSRLDARPKKTALAIFLALADAEAAVHGTSPEEVHFHEVGAVDSIVDIVGAAVGLDLLGIERVFSGPISLGHGFVNARHGL
ncbi:MAG: LarC family nickel insertion protein, partial [Nitrolancea sp.]